MSPLVAIVGISSLLLIAVIAVAVLWAAKRRQLKDLRRLNDEMVAVSADASVGRRLTIPGDTESAHIAHTVNRLFDALSERDEKIQGRDRLFRDFAHTLPEIVLIHDEKILLANESAAALVGMDPAQLIGRDVADLGMEDAPAFFEQQAGVGLSAGAGAVSGRACHSTAFAWAANRNAANTTDICLIMSLDQ